MEWARFRLTRNWRSAGEVSGSVAGAGAYSRAVHADPIRPSRESWYSSHWQPLTWRCMGGCRASPARWNDAS